MTLSYTQRRLGLSTRQTGTLAVIGAVLWFIAAILLRTIGPLGAFDGGNRVLLYALTIPGTIPFVWMTQRLARLASNQIAIGIAIVTATALLLDGVAVAWFPQLYGHGLAQVTSSAAAILWGAGIGLILAFLMNKENVT